MAETIHPFYNSRLARIEPHDRLVVLARTIQAQDPGTEAELKDSAVNWARFGETCLGQALYRHRSVFRNASEAAVLNDLELSYFRDIVPADAIQELVVKQQPAETQPAASGDPADHALGLHTTAKLAWLGRSARNGRRRWNISRCNRPTSANTETIMRKYIGPAAAKLVQANRIETFRTMETAAVLYLDRALKIDWNQIYLCEVDANGFNGLGQEFDAALREVLSDGGFAAVFAGLDRMRTIPRWTFNDPVVEADAAVGREGSGGTMSEVRPGSFAWRLRLIPHPNRPQTERRALVTVNGDRNLGRRGEAKAGHGLAPGKPD